jgi:integrase
MLIEARREAQDRGEDPAAVGIRPWVLHDLRRSAASGMARLGVDLPVIEKVLNHVSGSFGGIAGVYQRHSFAAEKRAALQAWANLVETIVSDKNPENVIALPPRQTRAR